MKSSLKIFFILPFLQAFIFCNANDGAFRGDGNQLIPMYETDISVKKEILTIRRINSKQAEIAVNYEFLNPKASKEIEVGFEAFSPVGDVDPRPVNGRHPYITHFTVIMNEKTVAYKVSIVSDSLYYKNGKYKSKTIADAIKESDETDVVNFYYVYHFRALFKTGINIIRHTYVVDLSNSVEENYSLQYILTAATRWSNRQIDDFTLQIDMGDFQGVSIEQTFFKSASEWIVSGVGKHRESKSRLEGGKGLTEFYIRKGVLVFQKKNFRPTGEIYLHSFNNFNFDLDANENDLSVFDSKRNQLPFSIEEQDQIQVPVNELSKQILKNLPFARRGYVFKSPELKTYYEHQKWYFPDPAYVPQLSQLTLREQEWLKKYNQ